MSEYGDKFESMIIIVMSILIVVSIAAVIGVNKAVHSDCNPSYHTYCGETSSGHH